MTLHLPAVRIGNLFEFTSFFSGKNKTGKVEQINQKQVLINRKWFSLSKLNPIRITRNILLQSGFTEFGWAKDASVFQCHHFKCTLDSEGLSLFCENLKNLKPIKYLHELQNLYFDLFGEELTMNQNAIQSAEAALA